MAGRGQVSMNVYDEASPFVRTWTPAVTVLHHTFYGFAILFMGSVCDSLLNPPAVPLESSGKVMEMGEHPPSQSMGVSRRPYGLL